MRKFFKRPIIIVFLVAVIGILLYHSGFIVLDHSAIVGVEGMTWKGKGYSKTSGKYTEGKTIAKSKDGSWDINEVKEDPEHRFVVARAFLNDFLYVADDYNIPTSGKITTVCWNGEYIKDNNFIDAISQIDMEKTTSFQYETEGIYILTENQRMKDLYFAYEDCPVTTEYKGYMGKVNGEWVITTDISSDQRNDDGSPKPHTVSCYSIPDKYASILEKYYFE